MNVLWFGMDRYFCAPFGKRVTDQEVWKIL